MILVAGIGNIFMGDDGFGVAVAQELLRRPQPEGVKVVDFGIRSFDLAYALMDDYAATILIDALGRGEPPATLYVFEPDLDAPSGFGDELPDAHSLHPAAVIELVRQMGGHPRRILLVGCEPLTFGPPEIGQMGLSEPVQARIAEAVEMVESLARQLLADEAAAIC